MLSEAELFPPLINTFSSFPHHENEHHENTIAHLESIAIMCFGSKKTENNSAEPNTRFFTIETLQQTPLTSTSWSPNSVSTPSWPPAAAGPASGPAATPYLTSQPPTPGQYATASRQPPTRLPRNSTPSGNYSTQYPQTPTYAQNPTGQFQNPAPLPRNSIPPAQIPEAFGNARARGYRIPPLYPVT